jgi:hypothetical protein
MVIDNVYIDRTNPQKTGSRGMSSRWLDQVAHLTEGKENLQVYEIEKIEAQPEMIRELAIRFKIEGEVESKEDIYLISQNGRAVAMYRKTGAFWYADLAKIHNKDYRPELPSEDEAIKIATEFLKHDEWLPKGAILDGVHRGVFEQVEGKNRERKSEWANHLCVDFRFAFKELRTYGPGAKIKVYVGDKGEVIGLFRAVPSLRQYKEYPVISCDELRTALGCKLGVPLKGIKFRGVKLAYHAESCVLNTGFVQPVYVFVLATPIKGKRRREATMVEFETHPLPATKFAPIAAIKAPTSGIEVRQDKPFTLSYDLIGGTPPFKVSWDSNVDGHLSDEQILVAKKLSIAYREGSVTSHTIKVTVTDANGMQDSHQVLVKVLPREGRGTSTKVRPKPKSPDDPYVGVEWCNIYHGIAPDISGTDESAQGFKDHIKNLSGWSSRFDWGNDGAWEQDFKFATAPGGGTDSFWIDNVDFAFFAGHGGPGSFWFGSAVDDHEMRAQDARWGDGIVNWIVLHACQTMKANFGWTVWCNAFNGLHQMFGFHTNTEGSTPPLGSRFALWMSMKWPFLWEAFEMQTAWKLACSECFDSSVEYAVIYAGQSGTDTYRDHLPNYGYVSPDPTSPTFWVYYKSTC